MEDNTTTEIATATEAATTTAATTATEATSAIPFISNAGFDDDDSSVAPWELYYVSEFDVSIASDVKHDGRNSALMAKSLGGTQLIDYIRQPLQGSITAGVTYTMSAWAHMLISKQRLDGCHAH
ncbi:hypothetical protein J7337_003633 [Fusarium musae]|uniref:Uncharacterized protein n=1 Tax=Fusarium musae TaxID=1042133 RepID=A0A9P8DL09_9HYPO|nr:hypothetical protein J7337_003633 [Fusarium musae]KAG9503682.1 hypothetical protein J7337_003633 [Fusarium musae]